MIFEAGHRMPYVLASHVPQDSCPERVALSKTVAAAVTETYRANGKTIRRTKNKLAIWTSWQRCSLMPGVRSAWPRAHCISTLTNTAANPM